MNTNEKLSIAGFMLDGGGNPYKYVNPKSSHLVNSPFKLKECGC